LGKFLYKALKSVQKYFAFALLNLDLRLIQNRKNAEECGESFLIKLQLSLRPPAHVVLLILTICTGMSSAQANVPYSAVEILSRTDTDLYLKIFNVQKKGQWKQADKLVKKLSNKLLLGHVLAQRFLHPTKYRSRYKELKGWLNGYSDHPQAVRIYKLALRRKPKNWRMPKVPQRLTTKSKARAPMVNGIRIKGKKLIRADRLKAKRLQRSVRHSLRRGHTLAAKRTLQTRNAKRYLSDGQYDQLAARLGFAYFTDGLDKWALKWAVNAAERSGKLVPEAHWTAGLASWRLGKKDTAVRHFEDAARSSSSARWFQSAAAFWAARANLVNRQPEKVNDWLERASIYPRTFYGLLARHILGKPADFRWTPPPLHSANIKELSNQPRGKRGMALLQIGNSYLAEREFQELARSADDPLAKTILALAAQHNMASLAVRLDSRLYPRGGGYDGAAYPIPAWVPADGFLVDRALIYALIRQESRFNPKAKSRAGARGLMQLMPRTARFVARAKGIKYQSWRKLYQPKINLTIGQRYIEMLLKDPMIKGDLFLMAAAWNGGPGNLNKWRKRSDHLNDPLFLIESLPSRETRHFIERVLANLWIYRYRLKQETPSLDAIAAGKRPVYTALGDDVREVAENNGIPK